jgi:hypothetical protein
MDLGVRQKVSRGAEDTSVNQGVRDPPILSREFERNLTVDIARLRFTIDNLRLTDHADKPGDRCDNQGTRHSIHKY